MSIFYKKLFVKHNYNLLTARKYVFISQFIQKAKSTIQYMAVLHAPAPSLRAVPCACALCAHLCAPPRLLKADPKNRECLSPRARKGSLAVAGERLLFTGVVVSD